MSDASAFDPFIEVAKQELIADGVDEAGIAAAEFAMRKAGLTMTGDAVGTIRKQDGTNAVAHRVLRADGVPVWRVTMPDGSQYDDMQPTLAGWMALFEPAVVDD